MCSTNKMNKQIQIPCNPETFGQSSFPLTFQRKKFFIRPKSKPVKAVTLGSEVDSLVTEWYTFRGLPVPPEDLLGCEIDAAEAAEAARLDAAWAKAQEGVPTSVPDYGTPEFWAYHRAKKAAENKRRAEEGLPPLPTKKELEAEKAKKKAEREAEKEKKVAEKAAKKATKANTVDDLTNTMAKLSL